VFVFLCGSAKIGQTEIDPGLLGFVTLMLRVEILRLIEVFTKNNRN